MNIISELNNVLPFYSIELPVSKITVQFTPFKVKDIKNISIILQENNKKIAYDAMITVLKNNTKLSEKELYNLCLADAEYLFLYIRSKSIDEVLNLIFNDQKIKINISEIKIKNSLQNKTIDIGDSIKLFLKTPNIKLLNKLDNFEKNDYFKACIQKLSIKNEIYDCQKYIPGEIKDILDNMPIKVLNELETFIKNEPELFVNLEDKKTNEVKEVCGILNFFIFR